MAIAGVVDLKDIAVSRAAGALALVAGGAGLFKAGAAGIAASAQLAAGVPAALVLAPWAGSMMADVVLWALLSAWLFSIGAGLRRHEFPRGQARFVGACGMVAAALYLALVTV